MIAKIPYRSIGGCLTCKRRKKKCDETKPVCGRCNNGGFECLGYPHLGITGASVAQQIEDMSSFDESATGSIYGVCSPNPIIWTEPSYPEGTNTSAVQCWGRQMRMGRIFRSQRISIPTEIQSEALELEQMEQFVVLQYSQVTHQLVFKSLPFPLEAALVRRVKGSQYTRLAMYIGARIVRALIDDTNWETYIDWINDFHKNLVNIPVDPSTSIEELATRLDALHTTALFTFILLSSSTGYSFYRRCTLAFLQLASKFPELWAKDSAISILHALHARRFEITQFVFVDTITALIFGIAPLLHYDTSFHNVNRPRDGSFELLEWIYSCPPMIVFLLAKINSSRTLGLNGQADSNRLAQLEIEEHLQQWQPTTDKDEDSSNRVVRLAVLECWRQAVLIYMYMGVCGVDSADPRVQTAVRQMAQLASTVGSGSQFEGHLLIPCLIAGVVAQKEKHRAIFYTKIQASVSLKPTPPLLKLVRAADFICVLNHLWHGAASEGRAITWEDYINSRSAALPLDI